MRSRLSESPEVVKSPPFVFLSKEDERIAIALGQKRFANAGRFGRKDRNSEIEGTIAEAEGGAFGEAIVARKLGLKFTGEESDETDKKLSDLPHGIEVRTRLVPNNESTHPLELPFRPTDVPQGLERAFVLVHSWWPLRRCRIVGWCFGREAKEKIGVWKKPPKWKDFAWLVAEEELRPFVDLQALVTGALFHLEPGGIAMTIWECQSRFADERAEDPTRLADEGVRPRKGVVRRN